MVILLGTFKIVRGRKTNCNDNTSGATPTTKLGSLVRQELKV
jgi:hypothetical protein